MVGLSIGTDAAIEPGVLGNVTRMNTEQHNDEDKSVADAVDDKAKALQQNFGIPAETAAVAADDQLSKLRRKPASNDVDTQRGEAARAEEEAEK